jgi:hypothetical protein
MDFLTVFKAKLDLQHRIIRYRDKDTEDWVALAQDVTIPPRHQAMVAVVTSFPQGTCVLLEPCARLNGTQGLHSARSLAMVGKDGLAWTHVCNVSAQPLTIPAGMPVGSAERYVGSRQKREG